MNANKALWEKGDFTRLAATMRESGEDLHGRRRSLAPRSFRRRLLGFLSAAVVRGCGVAGLFLQKGVENGVAGHGGWGAGHGSRSVAAAVLAF